VCRGCAPVLVLVLAAGALGPRETKKIDLLYSPTPPVVRVRVCALSWYWYRQATQKKAYLYTLLLTTTTTRLIITNNIYKNNSIDRRRASCRATCVCALLLGLIVIFWPFVVGLLVVGRGPLFYSGAYSLHYSIFIYIDCRIMSNISNHNHIHSCSCSCSCTTPTRTHEHNTQHPPTIHTPHRHRRARGRRGMCCVARAIHDLRGRQTAGRGALLGGTARCCLAAHPTHTHTDLPPPAPPRAHARFSPASPEHAKSWCAVGFVLYRILPIPIVYGVYTTKERSGKGVNCAIVVQ